MNDEEWAAFAKVFRSRRTDISLFMDGVFAFFGEHELLKSGEQSVIHSQKKRMKDESHLREKVARKLADGRNISPDSLIKEITDLAGIRILLLFQNDFSVVDSAIRTKVNIGDWVFNEEPKAFTWDPEAKSYFERFDLKVEQRDSFYTSVHYLIKPRQDSDICCEIQVRTLFEEIWGEVDHRLNYPVQTESLACREQLMVLSKIVGAGSRLVDAIQRTIESGAK
ncbi:RelA/SpoT domain-containing protein [Novosphingobium sp. MMS21-SN21R]|uniref:RelA/SpoT domain-containing protein n=1 Tax=Novosphingobium sp. MMS21-SN21R TaxID=2969298 RepID=UPI0028837392|nr:RelA/SpoT domain-containing protein [Novosphingobium sp. MMS21-SN21R]MDT0508668.1 RelA/SpoT domain-containing protein [Novosphingobium sp. MMS21-SN21R]